MLYLYTGTPGSGKSLHVASVIRRALRSSARASLGDRPAHPVVANFPINPSTCGYSAFTYVPNDRLTPDYLYEYARLYWRDRPVREDTIYLVVDEAQLLFNSRDWGRGNRSEWIRFLSQHRHFGYCVIFVTQFDRMIDRQIRCLAEYEVKHRKVSNIGLKGRIVSAFALGQLFVAVYVYYGMNEKTDARFFRGYRSLYRLYDSYALFGAEGGAEGRGTGDPAPMAAPARSVLRIVSQAVSCFRSFLHARLSATGSRSEAKRADADPIEIPRGHADPTLPPVSEWSPADAGVGDS
ncbi:MAG TPA: zonular occludens toxin domain-containing protein [Candidatus Olsenella excrementigallinarum]|nr:zonular occludens toxin domain-containing protein [Candidatus Olsenella excrementigallinarum]